MKVLGNKAWNHNFVSKPARVFEAKCIDCRRKCTEIQGEKSPKGTFPITSVSHPTPAPALNNFCQLQIGCKDQLFENWRSSIFYLRYNVVWCSHLKIWSAAAAGYFEGNMKLCTFFKRSETLNPCPLQPPVENEKRKGWGGGEGGGGGGETKVGSGYFPPSNSLSDLSPPRVLRCQENFTNWTFLLFE